MNSTADSNEHNVSNIPHQIFDSEILSRLLHGIDDYMEASNSINSTQTVFDNTTKVIRRNVNRARIQVAVLSSVFFVAVVGNTMVVTQFISLCRRNRKLSRMNNMALHLCCADFFVAFCNILPQICWTVTLRFHGGNALCKTVKFVQIASMFTSSFVLLATAVDRYVAICHPFHFYASSAHSIHYLALGAWLVALLLSVPQLFLFGYGASPVTGIVDCTAGFGRDVERIYVVWFSVAIYVAPLILLCLLYSRVCLVVYRSVNCTANLLRGGTFAAGTLESTSATAHRRGTGTGTGNEGGFAFLSPPRRSSSVPSTVKTVKFTITVIVSYVLCWGPFFFSILWRTLDRNAPSEG